MASPHDWWNNILRWSGYLTETPEGTVPAPLMEGVIFIESRGEPRAYNRVGDTYGLGQVSPVGLEYGGFKAIAEQVKSRAPRTAEEKLVSDALRPHGGNLSTNLLYDPDVNIAIMTYGINYRSEHSGERDWLRLIVTGYFGAGPEGDISNGTTQQDYYDQLSEYIKTNFGQATLTQLQSGTYPTGRQGDIADESPSGTPTAPTTGPMDTGNPLLNPLGFIQDFISSILAMLPPFAGRVGFYAVGIALLAVGAWVMFS